MQYYKIILPVFVLGIFLFVNQANASLNPLDATPAIPSICKISNGTHVIQCSGIEDTIKIKGHGGTTVTLDNATKSVDITSITTLNSTGLVTMENLGGGTPVYAGNTTNTNFQFNTLSASGASSLSLSAGLINIYTHTYQNNTGTGLGTNGVDIYKGMSGNVLTFAKLVSGNGNCVLSDNSTNAIITCSTGGSGGETLDTMQNIGTGEGSIYAGNTTNTHFNFKTLKQGTHITIVNNTNDLTIDTTGLLSSAIQSINTDTSPSQTIQGILPNSTVTDAGNVHTVNIGSNVATLAQAQIFTANKTFAGNLTMASNFYLKNNRIIGTLEQIYDDGYEWIIQPKTPNNDGALTIIPSGSTGVFPNFNLYSTNDTANGSYATLNYGGDNNFYLGTYAIGSGIIHPLNIFVDGSIEQVYNTNTTISSVVNHYFNGGLTLNSNATSNGHAFTGLTHVNATKFFQNGNQVIDTLVQGSGVTITGTGNTRTISSTGSSFACNSTNNCVNPNDTQTITGLKTFQTGGINMSSADISLHGNKLNTTNYSLKEEFSGDLGSIITLSSDNFGVQPSFWIYSNDPVYQHFTSLSLLKNNNISNSERLQLGNDPLNSDWFSLEVKKSGSGLLHPLYIKMDNNYLELYNTDSTITSLVNHTFNNGIIMSNSNIKLDYNYLVNHGHKQNLQNASGTICLTNQTGSCGTGSGITTISNIGHGGNGVLASIVGSTLQGKNITSTDSHLLVSSNGTDVNLSTSGLLSTAITTSQNAGKATGSVGVLATPTSTTIKGRNMTGGTGISVTKTNDTDIQITNTSPLSNIGEVNVGHGTGSKGLSAGISGNNVQIKNATAGTGISIAANATDVTFTNAGVTSITGTAHNVTTSASTGAVTLNLGDNVVMTGGSAQTVSKSTTFNSLTLGGDENANSHKITSLATPTLSGDAQVANHLGLLGSLVTGTCSNGQSLQYQTSNSTWICASSGSGVTSFNGQSGPAIILNRGSVTNMSQITNSSNTISYQLKNDIVLTNGSAQTISKPITSSGGITMSGSDINLETNKLKTTNFQFTEPSANLLTMESTSTASFPSIALYGNNVGRYNELDLFNGGSATANMQYIFLVTTTSANTIGSYTTGAASKIPLNFQMKDSVDYAINTNDTLTSYVNHYFRGGITVTGSNINLGSNTITNSGHASSVPTTTGTLCQTNQTSTCGKTKGVLTMQTGATTVAANTLTYITASGTTTTQTTAEFVAPVTGTITQVTGTLSGVIGSGKTMTVTVRDVTAGTTLACTTATNGASCTATGTLAVTVNDLLDIEAQSSAGSNTPRLYAGIVYQQ